MLDSLKKLADKYIIIYKDNLKELKKYQLIREILNRKDCFLNMSIEYAYSILRDLQIPENKIKTIYSELISIQ